MRNVLLQFVEMIADMEKYTWSENNWAVVGNQAEDAFVTINQLIEEARIITGREA